MSERLAKAGANANWFQADRPTRGVNIAAPANEVTAMCQKKNAAISAMEGLADGNTRVILVTMAAADIIRHAFKDKLLPHNAPRMPTRGRYA